MLSLLSNTAVDEYHSKDLAKAMIPSGFDYSEYCLDNKVYIRITFTQSFKTEYLRNNKCNGTKNIRCFPCCTEPTHSTQGFCGQAVLAHCTIIRRVSDTSPNDLLFVGEFQPIGSEFDPLTTGISESEIMQNSISTVQKYFIGAKCLISRKEVNEYVHEEMELKFDAKPWQYAWVGSKHKKDYLHTFCVSILTSRMQFHRAGMSKNIKASELQLLEQCQSPAFRIASMRRNNPRVKERKAEEAVRKCLLEANEIMMKIEHEGDVDTKTTVLGAKANVGKKKKSILSKKMKTTRRRIGSESSISEEFEEHLFTKSTESDDTNTIEMSMDEERDLVDDIAKDIEEDSDSSLSDEERSYLAVKRSKYSHVEHGKSHKLQHAMEKMKRIVIKPPRKDVLITLPPVKTVEEDDDDEDDEDVAPSSVDHQPGKLSIHNPEDEEEIRKQLHERLLKQLFPTLFYKKPDHE